MSRNPITVCVLACRKRHHLRKSPEKIAEGRECISCVGWQSRAQHSATGHGHVFHHGKTMGRGQDAVELSIGVCGLWKKQLDTMDKGEECGRHISNHTFFARWTIEREYRKNGMSAGKR